MRHRIVPSTLSLPYHHPPSRLIPKPAPSSPLTVTVRECIRQYLQLMRLGSSRGLLQAPSSSLARFSLLASRPRGSKASLAAPKLQAQRSRARIKLVALTRLYRIKREPSPAWLRFHHALKSRERGQERESKRDGYTYRLSVIEKERERER